MSYRPMQNSVVWILLSPVAYALTAVLGAAAAGQEVAQERGVREILAASLRATQVPPRCQFRTTATVEYLNGQDERGVSGWEEQNRVFRDGDRLDVAHLSWTVRNGQKQRNYLVRTIWDGKRSLTRQQFAGEPSAQVELSTTSDPKALKRILRSRAYGGILDGWIHADEKPMAALLLDAGTGSIVARQRIGERECVVVEGTTKCGVYRLWLDTAEGFGLRQAVVRRFNGDVYGETPIEGGPNDGSPAHTMRIEDIEWSLVDGRRVPVGATVTTEGRWSAGTEHNRSIVKRTEIETAVDFKSGGAFVMVGVPQGTVVMVDDRMPGDHRPYVWRDGDVRIDDDAPITKLIDEAVSSEKRSLEEGAR